MCFLTREVHYHIVNSILMSDNAALQICGSGIVIMLFLIRGEGVNFKSIGIFYLHLAGGYVFLHVHVVRILVELRVDLAAVDLHHLCGGVYCRGW